MRNPKGYGMVFSPCGVIEEHDTLVCGHCNRIVIVRPKCDPYDLGGMCRLCEKMICPACVNKGVCDPLEKKLEREEAKYRARRSYGV